MSKSLKSGKKKKKEKKEKWNKSAAIFGFASSDPVDFCAPSSSVTYIGTTKIGSIATPQSYLTPYVPCYEKHAPLHLGGGVFAGGSCVKPLKGFDIYVGLDYGMKRAEVYPWSKVNSQGPIEVYFPITDMSVPSDISNFKEMITWLQQQLVLGKRVHVGCLGGHGRTGMVLAALVRQVTDDLKAAEWVRKEYCKHAIESVAQVNFLHTHFGIEKVAATKQGGSYSSFNSTKGFSSAGSKYEDRIVAVNNHWNIWE
jgi:hypothetical protein